MSDYQYRILGYENQVLELTLQPMQTIQAEKGAMTYMDEIIDMTTRLGENTGLFRAIKRRIAGESILINEFTNRSPTQPAQLALSPQKPSHIVMVPLTEQQPDLVCRPDTFLAGSVNVHVSITRGAWGPALIGGGHLIMQKLHGTGDVFMTGNGAVIEKRLRPDQTVVADLESIIAFEETVSHRARILKGIRNQLFGGESIIVVTATGPGTVWFQSISHFKVAESHMKALIRKEARVLRKS